MRIAIMSGDDDAVCGTRGTELWLTRMGCVRGVGGWVGGLYPVLLRGLCNGCVVWGGGGNVMGGASVTLHVCVCGQPHPIEPAPPPFHSTTNNQPGGRW
jgi:hypothetical protein